MIQMENVTYSYDKGYGIKNVNFTIDDSEFTFLIGPTGSGKTTIMKLIYMALIPQSGVVTTGKFRSDKIKKRKIPFLRRKIGMIFQDYHLLRDRSLFENIASDLNCGFFRPGSNKKETFRFLFIPTSSFFLIKL